METRENTVPSGRDPATVRFRTHTGSPRALAVTLTSVGIWALVWALGWPAAHAEEVHRKFRLALLVGGDSPTEEVRSNSANILTILDEDGILDDRYNDPRNDAAITGALKARPGTLSTVSLQYALTPLFLLEGRVGYRSNDIGQIEVQEVLNYRRTVRVPAGELTRVPLQLNGVWRFRPKAPFNPYLGAGLGYSIVDYSMSPELRALSDNLEQSRGKPTVLLPESQFDVIDVTLLPLRTLTGAKVTTGSGFEWQLVGGAEFRVGRRWAAFVDLGHAWSGIRWDVGFDGGEDLGVGVPQATTTQGSDLATRVYGPLQILVGGAVDLTGDGVPERGFYYIEGGGLRLDGFTFQFGMRYTF